MEMPRAAPTRWRAAAFVAAVMLSAALMFTLEPMIARLLLPRFGGSAAVWSVALAFFQTALLLGYAYAHLLARFAPGRGGVFIHIGVLALGALALPPAVTADAGAADAAPALEVLKALAFSIGLPFVALSANAPLLQAWFARAFAPARDPYPLYAASNVGSLGALIAYPFVVEPNATLHGQGMVWAAGYGALMAIIAAAALAGPLLRPATTGGARAPLAPQRLAWWAFLGFVPSAALVAVTAHISADVAAAPFLWIAPLALYLATFVVAFSGWGAAVVRHAHWLLPPALLGLAVLLGAGWRLGFAPGLLAHLTGFLLLALVCHARLAADRPAPERLTTFYLAMSAGGVAGGLFAALAAPALFATVAEYPVVLALAALAAPRRRWLLLAGVAALLLVPRLLAPDAARETSRSFYGVHTIETTADGAFRTLRHGLEVHGAQSTAALAPGRKPLPLTYYHEDSPISEAIDATRARLGGGAIRIGVIGLGAGSIACLAEPEDALDFYEIDPAVVSIARDGGRFAFLSACAPKAAIVLGDARRTLTGAAARYDILIVDAFSSDAIPTHLLTREALALFMRRLNPDGLLLLHISNDHLRLNEVVAATARAQGLAVRINDEEPEAGAGAFIYQPTVAAIAAGQAGFGALARSDEWPDAEAPPDVRPWTDDYADLFAALLSKLRKD